NVRDDHLIIARVRRRHVGERETRVGCLQDIRAVELPLVAQGRTTCLDAENSFHPPRHVQALRWFGDGGGLGEQLRWIESGKTANDRRDTPPPHIPAFHTGERPPFSI